jgi:histone acetyltransferase (RNA polymerase elongator complex component)
LPEIAGNAMIREVHVYGAALGIGAESGGQPQHAGLGTRCSTPHAPSAATPVLRASA